MTLIGRTIHVTGDVTSDEDIAIEGRVSGLVLVRAGTLTIGDHARLDAEVRGVRVHVRGEVKGAITASERIELTPSAVVRGALSASHVVMADGATFNGGIDMGQRTIAAKMAKYKAAHTA